MATGTSGTFYFTHFFSSLMTKDGVKDVLCHITTYIALYIWKKEYLYTHAYIHVCVYTFAYIHILANAFNVGI